MLSDRIVVQITAKPGETFLDRMIALVEGAARQKTPNEIALNILLASLTIVFLLAVVDAAAAGRSTAGAPQSVIVLVALLVCLIPTTIGALLSAIGIAGMDRLVQRNVLAMSGRAVEAAGDVNTLLLDKTGTITLGNRQAAEFLPRRRGRRRRARRRRAAGLAWPTRRPRAARSSSWPRPHYGLRERRPGELTHAHVRPVHRPDPDERRRPADDGAPQVRKGAAGAVTAWVRDHGGARPAERWARWSTRSPASGGTPLVVAEQRGASGAAGARRHPPQGRRQGRHARAVRRAAPRWASAR